MRLEDAAERAGEIHHADGQPARRKGDTGPVAAGHEQGSSADRHEQLHEAAAGHAQRFPERCKRDVAELVRAEGHPREEAEVVGVGQMPETGVSHPDENQRPHDGASGDTAGVPDVVHRGSLRLHVPKEEQLQGH